MFLNTAAFRAYGVANGGLANTESPNTFTVYNGKLYLCGNPDALKSFKTNIDDNIGRGCVQWRQLTGF